MNIFFNMDRTDFIEQLRHGAIKSGGSPQLIDQIDSLHELHGLEDDLEKAGEELKQMEDNRDDIWAELITLLKAMPDILTNQLSALELNTMLRRCLRALERHSTEDFQKGQVALLKGELEL